MSRAAYKFYNKQDNELVDVVEFDLIDNPGCRAWQFAVLLNDKSRILNSVSIAYRHRSTNEINDLYTSIRLIVEKLSETDFSVEFDVPESPDLVTQDLLNRLHRHFTNSCSALWNPRYARSGPEQIPIDKLLHELNHQIHDLETSISTPNKIKVFEYYKNAQPEINLRNTSNIGYDIFPFRRYHSYDPADLILDPYILGKTLMESFCCHDDPNSWDTAGHVRTNGGAIILMDDTRQKIYNDSYFIEWLRSMGLEKRQTFGDFPLGHFVPGHKDKLMALKKDFYKYLVQVDIIL